jgi:hypothetical protein
MRLYSLAPFFQMKKQRTSPAEYRVTYVDSVLREVTVTASSEDEAIHLARAGLEAADHHHTCDAWNDDWQAEIHRHRPVVNRHCFECGEVRE